MKICIAICLGCALVAIGECQDITALMFQAMGIEGPLLPPTMPRSLREHLYPQQRQQQLLQQQQQQLQKQRYLAYLTSQQQRQSKDNPYTLSGGSYAGGSRMQPRSNSVYSSANRIRVPGTANSVGVSKGNPYGSSYQGSTNKGNPYGSSNRATSNKGNPYGSSYQGSSNKAASSSSSGNPYSLSRGPTRGIPPMRNSASLSPVPIPGHATRLLRQMQQMKTVGEQPRKIGDAKSAGCSQPGEAAPILMFSDCRNPTSRMICQAEMMTCMNVGMGSMCCPYGINGLALDAIGYVNKMQQFIEGFA